MKEVNPAAVTLARESRRLTQQKLAHKLEISQAKLSKLENGQGEMTEALLGKLSEVLGYSASFFAEDLRVHDLPAVFYRKLARVTATDERAIRAQVNILRLGIGRLLKSVEIPESRVPRIDLNSAETSPTLFARQLRAHWGLPRGPIENLTDVLERAGVIVVRCDFGEAAVDGLSMWIPSDGLPPMIFLNARRPGDRCRFTLAHELAHLVFHYSHPIPPEHSEDEANAFAAELLAPASEVRPYLVNPTFDALFSLKRHWGVSMAFLLHRGSDLGRIPTWKARKMWIEAGKLGYRAKEPFALEPEEPTILKKLVSVHPDELGYNDEELRELMFESGALETNWSTRKLRVVK